MAGDIRRVRCEHCGMYMMYVPRGERYIPFEVVVASNCEGGQRTIFYYECSCQYSCAWWIPAGFGEKEFLCKRHFNRTLDEVLP